MDHSATAWWEDPTPEERLDGEAREDEAEGRIATLEEWKAAAKPAPPLDVALADLVGRGLDAAQEEELRGRVAAGMSVHEAIAIGRALIGEGPLIATRRWLQREGRQIVATREWVRAELRRPENRRLLFTTRASRHRVVLHTHRVGARRGSSRAVRRVARRRARASSSRSSDGEPPPPLRRLFLDATSSWLPAETCAGGWAA